MTKILKLELKGSGKSEIISGLYYIEYQTQFIPSITEKLVKYGGNYWGFFPFLLCKYNLNTNLVSTTLNLLPLPPETYGKDICLWSPKQIFSFFLEKSPGSHYVLLTRVLNQCCSVFILWDSRYLETMFAFLLCAIIFSYAH